MRFLARVVQVVVLFALVSVVFPSAAAAQHSLTGRFVELLPGGPLPPDTFSQFVGFTLWRAWADGSPSGGTGVGKCVEPDTVNCIAADGSFTVIDLLGGTYRVAVDADLYLEKMASVTVNGPTDIGDIALIRKPFLITPTVGTIPATGGVIPVTIRVQTRWNIPNLPITARVLVDQEDKDGRFQMETGQVINFPWPAELADSGTIPLTTIDVSPTAPAGSKHCAGVVITLQNNPRFELGRAEACRGKQP